MPEISGYEVFREFVRHAIVKVFFRTIDVVGKHKVPGEGPVIFVSNHANQFVDPLMLVVNTSRVIRFLMASKSMRRPIIGHIAQVLSTIGVERPQDLAKKGTGTIFAEKGGITLTGEGTKFMSQLKAGFKVKVGDGEVTVKAVDSEISCKVSPCPETFDGASFVVFPKIDQGDVYGEVHKALRSGDCIGIFPEGGSHDQTSMLELKPGAAIMALGAMNAGAGQVQIIPVGLTYFEPFRFRSRVVVEFGDPIYCPFELAERYKTDKRGAVQELMETIDHAMHALKPDVKDYNELQGLLTMRALYRPRGIKLTAEENNKLMRQFVTARKALRDDQHAIKLFTEVKEYNEMLKAEGLTDRDVRLNVASTGANIWTRTIKALFQVLFLAPIVMPSSALATPIAFLNFYMAQREKTKALAGSSVKVKGLDVVASYKILVSLVSMPLYNLAVAGAAMWCLRRTGRYSPRRWHFPFIYWLGVPVAEYGSILACDKFFQAWTTLKSTFKFWMVNYYRSLVDRRAELQFMIRAYAEEVGPTFLENFEADRVVRKSELQKDWSRMLDADPSLSDKLLSHTANPSFDNLMKAGD